MVADRDLCQERAANMFLLRQKIALRTNSYFKSFSTSLSLASSVCVRLPFESNCMIIRVGWRAETRQI